MMKQCLLRRDNGDTETAWIESKFAKNGRSISIKVGDHWEDNWTVVEAYQVQMPAKYIQQRGRLWKDARKATDI